MIEPSNTEPSEETLAQDDAKWFEPTVTVVKYGKRTLTITGTNVNEPSPEALARAAAKIARIKVK